MTRLQSSRSHSPRGLPFFTSTEEPDATHGRVDERTISVYPFEPLEANLPGARSLAVIRRTRTGEPDEVPTTAFYITSHPSEKGCATEFVSLARGHWCGCKIRNHWVRDHCMREDDTRSKKYNLNCTLAGLRVCLITIKSLLYPEQSWPSLQERCQRDPSIAFRAIAKLRAK
jgi:hypothetical protein